MNNRITLVLVVLICILSILGVEHHTYNEKPKIETEGEITLGCKTSSEDLLSHGTASDDDLRAFFIEEDRNRIAEYGTLTYVAVDEGNNVVKQKAKVKVDPKVYDLHIEAVGPKIQIGEPFDMEEHFRLVNACGWPMKGELAISGLNMQLPGNYDVTVTAINDPSVRLEAQVEVADFRIPRIYLKEEEISSYAQRRFDDEYFLSLVDHVEDDHDSDLSGSVVCDWREVLSATASGYVDSGGTFEITYEVTDSEGFRGTASLKMRLRVPVQATSNEGGEENG